jgi:hypothetical protein
MKIKRPHRRYSSAIKVVARFRPPNALELAQGSDVVVNIETEDTLTIDMKTVPSSPYIKQRPLARKMGLTGALGRR